MEGQKDLDADLTGALDVADDLKKTDIESFIRNHFSLFPFTKQDLRITQYRNRSYLTTVEGIGDEFDHKKILKALQKLVKASGTVKKNKDELIIQLQGDCRDAIKDFLIYEGIGTQETVKKHGL